MNVAPTRPNQRTGGHLQISALTKPWDPAKLTWIVVTNVGDVDTPNLTLQYNCNYYYYTGSLWNAEVNSRPCSEVTWTHFPDTVLVPALKKGEFKAVGEFIGVMAGNGWTPNPNPSMPALFRGVFHIVQPHGDQILVSDLILATYKP